MGKATGFLEYERESAQAQSPQERIGHFHEFHTPLAEDKQKRQAARCMECGVPFCQYGETVAGMTSGCPLHNLIPEWDDLLYRGNLKEAFFRLRKTSSFPEFTSRVCPALCEKACTCGLNGEAVSTKENEYTITEYGYANGLMKPHIPQNRTAKKIAVIGSGPAGLAVADRLNFRGHSVTVYEKSDRIGGLLMYGIPNMKLEKSVIKRRTDIMEQEGIVFVTGAEAGASVETADLKEQYDAIVLACGAGNPRDIAAKGRDAKGIHFAVDFLTSTTKSLLDHGGIDDAVLKRGSYISAKGKDVVVIGGGDTGNDCVGTCMRHGAKSVVQLEMMPKPPEQRRESNPWPEWPLVLKTDYGQEEAADIFGSDPRIYQTTVKEFVKDAKGNLKELIIVSLESKRNEQTGRMEMTEVKDSEQRIPCQLALIAAGFLGPMPYLAKAFELETDGRSNILTEPETHQAVSKPAQQAGGKRNPAPSAGAQSAGIFAAGDSRTGQSLVVKAIADGRACAREVDEYLMGYSNL